MDVSGHDFWASIPTLLQDVQDAVFVAFDTELSGIPTRPHNRGPRGNGLPTLEERYADTKTAAEKYHILQLGLTFALREKDAPGSFVLKSYNFFLSPIPQERLWVDREYTFHSAAVKFLRQHHFNMDASLVSGVPYLSREEETLSRREWEKFKKSKDFSVDTVLRNDDQPSVAFMQQVRDDINAWIDDKTPNRPDYVNIAPGGFVMDRNARGLSSFQRRLVHQLILKEYPKLRTFTMPGDFIQVLARDDAKEKEGQTAKNESYERRLAAAIGLRWPIEAMARGNLARINPRIIQTPIHERETTTKAFETVRDGLKSKKTVLVGHNIFMDLMFLYTCFFGPLPASASEFTNEIGTLFPNIIDTKYMATHDSLNVSLDVSQLGELYHQLEHVPSPTILLHPDHARYAVEKPLHEAGYDSMLTATVLIRLSAKLQSEGKCIPAPSPSSEDETYHTPSEGTEPAGEKLGTAPRAKNVKLPLRDLADKLKSTNEIGNLRSTNGGRHTPGIAYPSREDDIQARIDQITGHTIANPRHDRQSAKIIPKATLTTSGSRFEVLANMPDSFSRQDRDEDLIDLSSPVDGTNERPSLVPTEANAVPHSGKAGISDEPRLEEMEDGIFEETNSVDENGSGDGVTQSKQSLLMPPFNSYFWEVYGNKMRVNGTKEGICNLKIWEWEP